MSPASTQRLTAIGTQCRRPTALLLPLAPLVLLVFVAMTLIASAGAALDRRRPIALDDTTDAAAEAPQAEQAAPASRFSFKPRRAVGVAAAVFGGVLVAASMAGGTYAFLNAQQTTPAVTVNSGSLVVTVQAAGTTAGATTAIPTAAWSNMLPGDFVGQTITVANTGSVATDVTARLSATSAWDIRLLVGSCPTTLLTSTPMTTSGVFYGTLPAGTSAVVCLQASLPSTAAASVESTSVPLTITFDAKQVAP